MKFQKLINSTSSFVGQNLPTILTGIGIVGVIGTAVLTGQASLEADKKLKELEDALERDLTKKEIITTAGPCYVYAVIAGVGTVGCMVGANRISAKQLTAALAVAKTAETALKENRDKVTELFGEKGLRKVDEKINESRAAKFLARTDDTIYETGHGNVLCIEGSITGIKFRAHPEWVHKCINSFNQDIINGGTLCWNDFLIMLIPTIDRSLLPDSAYSFGYNFEIKRQLLEIVEDSGLIGDTSEPYFIFKLKELPIYNYDVAYY